jgi:integrase
MASLAKRPDGRWRARYRDDVGQEHSRHFRRKVDGQKWLDEVTTATVTGTYVDPRKSRMTVQVYAEAWERRQIGRPASLRIVDNALRLHVVPVLGSRRIGTVVAGDVQALVKELSDTLAPYTVRAIFDVLARVFAAAVEDKVIAVSPCRRITLPTPVDTEVAPPTIEDVTRMVEVMTDRYRAAVVLLAGSGLRIGELLGLAIGDVDLEARTIRVDRQRLQNGQIGEPKTKKSRRTVPVGDSVVSALRDHLNCYPSADSLFTTPTGSPVGYPAWRKAWQQARDTSGLTMVSHDLRHFFASCLIASGTSVKQIQAVLGHQNAQVTLNTYAHLWPGGDDETRAVMDAILGVLRTTGGPNGPII